MRASDPVVAREWWKGGQTVGLTGDKTADSTDDQAAAEKKVD